MMDLLFIWFPVNPLGNGPGCRGGEGGGEKGGQWGAEAGISGLSDGFCVQKHQASISPQSGVRSHLLSKYCTINPIRKRHDVFA